MSDEKDLAMDHRIPACSRAGEGVPQRDGRGTRAVEAERGLERGARPFEDLRELPRLGAVHRENIPNNPLAAYIKYVIVSHAAKAYKRMSTGFVSPAEWQGAGAERENLLSRSKDLGNEEGTLLRALEATEREDTRSDPGRDNDWRLECFCHIGNFVDGDETLTVLNFVNGKGMAWYGLEEALEKMSEAMEFHKDKTFWIRNRKTDEVIPNAIL